MVVLPKEEVAVVAAAVAVAARVVAIAQVDREGEGEGGRVLGVGASLRLGTKITLLHSAHYHFFVCVYLNTHNTLGLLFFLFTRFHLQKRVCIGPDSRFI